jgi:hypothetical protein
MRKIKIFNEKEISVNTLLSNTFYTNILGVVMQVKPVSINPNGKIRLQYVLKNKYHITNILPAKLMTESQYFNIDKVKKINVKCEVDYVGDAIIQKYGKFINCKVVGINHDKQTKFDIFFIDNYGRFIQTTATRNQLFNDKKIKIMNKVLNPALFEQITDSINSEKTERLEEKEKNIEVVEKEKKVVAKKRKLKKVAEKITGFKKPIDNTKLFKEVAQLQSI